MPIEIPSQFDASRQNSEPHAALGITAAVENLGAMQAQDLIHAPETRFQEDFEFTITETVYTDPLRSAVKSKELQGVPINYIVIQSSVRGNPVYLNAGSLDVKWVQLGTVWYPMTDYYVPAGVGSVLFPLPLRRNWSFSFAVYPASGLTGTYKDAVRLLYGYLPDGNARQIYDYAK